MFVIKYCSKELTILCVSTILHYSSLKWIWQGEIQQVLWYHRRLSVLLEMIQALDLITYLEIQSFRYVCVSCVLVCSVIYRRDFRQTYHAICTTVYSTVVHSRQNICLKTLPKTTPFLPKVYDRFLCYRGFRLMQVFCTYSASFKSIPASVTENRRSNSPYSPFYVV